MFSGVFEVDVGVTEPETKPKLVRGKKLVSVERGQVALLQAVPVMISNQIEMSKNSSAKRRAEFGRME